MPSLKGAALLAVGAVLGTLLLAPPAAAGSTQTPGVAVGQAQGTVDWSAVAASGARFAYVQDTEGENSVNPYFDQQYKGSQAAGLLHGAVHFALPNASSGAAQADFFVAHGGGWQPDGATLPALLDIEINPYGATCYGLSVDGMVAWLAAFTAELHARSSRWPVIYTSTAWWNECTGDQRDFSGTDPLWITLNGSGQAAFPYNWSAYTFDNPPTVGDQSYFNGSASQLTALANG